LRHKEKGGVMIFDREKFAAFDEIYNHNSDDDGIEFKIEVSLVQGQDQEPEGSEGSEGISGCVSISEHEKCDDNEDKYKQTQRQEPSVPSVPSASLEFPPKCYHCSFSMYETKQDYESHCILRHPNKPAYPGPADIEALNLIRQNMQWER
jgi:hypothetical protein